MSLDLVADPIKVEVGELELHCDNVGEASLSHTFRPSNKCGVIPSKVIVIPVLLIHSHVCCLYRLNLLNLE